MNSQEKYEFLTETSEDEVHGVVIGGECLKDGNNLIQQLVLANSRGIIETKFGIIVNDALVYGFLINITAFMNGENENFKWALIYDIVGVMDEQNCHLSLERDLHLNHKQLQYHEQLQYHKQLQSQKQLQYHKQWKQIKHKIIQQFNHHRFH